MKILIPILNFGRSGGNRVLSELASRWVQSGHHVDFLVPCAGGEPYFPTIAGIVWTDALGRVSRTRPAQHRPQRGWRNLLSLYKGLRRIGRGYDVVLANHSLTAWPVAFAPKGPTRFYYIQAYEPEYFQLDRKPLAEHLARWSYRLPLIPIVNAPLYRNFKEIQADFVVPPGLDFTIFHPGADPAKSGRNGAFRVGCIGRPEPSKGTKHVLDAFEKLHEADDRYELRIAFGCSTEQSQPGIEVVVPRSDRELADFYRSLDVLVAPGTVQHGAAHYPVLEAMACGVPVVTTGYLPANEANSWLVPNEDSDSIVTAVRDIAQGRGVQERVAQALKDVGQFEWDRTAQDMLGILEQNIRQ